MDKKIIEAKFKKVTWPTILLGIGIVILVVGFFMALDEYENGGAYGLYMGKYTYMPHVDRHINFFDYFLPLMGFDRGDEFIPIMIYIAILLVIIAFIFVAKMNKCSLTITDKRVTGKASFGKQVDLPLNKISAISLGSSDSIGISTSSGIVKFWGVENRDEVYSALSNLVNNLQVNQAAPKNSDNYGNADELQKFKNLLDQGVITQEEFDAKKKQLLGL